LIKTLQKFLFIFYSQKPWIGLNRAEL